MEERWLTVDDICKYLNLITEDSQPHLGAGKFLDSGFDPVDLNRCGMYNKYLITKEFYMPKNHVQFQKGQSLRDFLKLYGTELQCAQAVFQARWPQGFRCPACGYHKDCQLHTRKVFQCIRCQRQVSLTAGTVFEHTKLPLTTWYLAIYLLTQSKNGISAMDLMRQLGVSYNTAWMLSWFPPPRSGSLGAAAPTAGDHRTVGRAGLLPGGAGGPLHAPAARHRRWQGQLRDARADLGEHAAGQRQAGDGRHLSRLRRALRGALPRRIRLPLQPPLPAGRSRAPPRLCRRAHSAPTLPPPNFGWGWCVIRYLNVSNETVYKWIEQRAMPGHRVGRRWMFKQDEVDAWVRSGGAADKSGKPDTEQ